jgi:DNA-binding MarR family transcriptional regulator
MNVAIPEGQPAILKRVFGGADLERSHRRRALAEFGASDQRTIAERAGFVKSDVTKIINRLESKSLVRRTEDEADHRRHSVALTAKGRRQLEVSDEELVDSMQVFLRGLDAEEYRQLQQLLLKAIQVHDERFAADPPARPTR